MYDSTHLNTPPTLSDVEPALLWSLRAWVIGFNRNIEVKDRIAQLWSSLGAPEAAYYIDGIMWALSQGVMRTVEVNCVCNPTVSPDESALLTLIAQQMPHENRALLGLLDMVTPNAALAMCDSGTRLRVLLVAVGHVLPGGAGKKHHRALFTVPPQPTGHGNHTIH